MTAVAATTLGRRIRRAVPSVCLILLCGCGHGHPRQELSHTSDPYNGPHEITVAGTVISGKEITAPLVIAADNVTVQNNRIHTATSAEYDVPILSVSKGTHGVRIIGNSLAGNGPSTDAAASSGVKLYGDDTVFSHNDIYWVAGDGVTIDGDRITVADNRLHDFAYRSGVHYDGLVYGGANTTNTVVIRGNDVDLWLPDGMTAAVSLPDEATNMIVEGNVLAGGNYAVMGGGGGVKFLNNRFSTKHSTQCGRYGTNARLGINGFGTVTWSGNRWTDGSMEGRIVELG